LPSLYLCLVSYSVQLVSICINIQRFARNTMPPGMSINGRGAELSTLCLVCRRGILSEEERVILMNYGGTSMDVVDWVSG
jgi:hypothetical protein